jgi:hypothetical protein
MTGRSLLKACSSRGAWRLIALICANVILLAILGLSLPTAEMSADTLGAPGQPRDTALVLVPLGSPDRLEQALAAGFRPYGRYSSSRGEFLLARVSLATDRAVPDVAFPVEVLDRDATGGNYFLAAARPGWPRPDWAAYGRVLWGDGTQVLLRTPAPDAGWLVGPAVSATRVTLEPVSLEVLPDASATAPEAITYNAVIAGMMSQVSSTTVYNYDAQLSGVVPVTVGGIPYTFATRYTYSGTPIQKATQFVGEHFTSLGYQVENHVWGTSGQPVTYPNVIAELPGPSSSPIYMITAHLDSYTGSASAPGADDNASGSTGVLVAADIMKQYQWDCTLRFALFTGEEEGELGSNAYAQRAKNNGENIAGVLNLDMLGYNPISSGKLDLFTTTSVAGSGPIADMFIDVVNVYGLNLVPVKYVNNSLYQQSDNYAFAQRGYPAILAIEDYLGNPGNNPYIHTTSDTLSRIDGAYFTDMVKASIGTFAHMTGCLHTASTAVTLADFSATSGPGGIGVSRLTMSNVGDLGYNGAVVQQISKEWPGIAVVALIFGVLLWALSHRFKGSGLR